MALSNRPPGDKAALDVVSMLIEDRIKYVVEKAAKNFADKVGRQLLTLIEPKSLAITAGVLVIWGGSQFLGVGEVADAVLLVGGYLMFGAVAIQAARLLYACGIGIMRAHTTADLDQASANLTTAVTLIGVQATLVILLHKPGSAMKGMFRTSDAGTDPFTYRAFNNLPKNRWWGYRPRTEGTLDPRYGAGEGGTSVGTGDIEYSLKGSDTDQRMALVHEKVHQLLTPKLRVLRQLRAFMRAQGYNRSYVLRYVEEAMAETIAQLRVQGMTKANFIEGIRFPVGPDYDVTVGNMKGELRQVFLGPIVVGGMTYQVWCARINPKKRVRR
jgi:hypothetical protein